MSGISVQQMADRVAQLMEERLRIKGKSLPHKLRRGGRLLPRRVRHSAAYLAAAADQARIPKLQLQLNQQRITEAYDACIRHLKPLGGGARRRAVVMNLVTSIAAIVVVTAVLVLAVLAWRGLI